MGNVKEQVCSSIFSPPKRDRGDGTLLKKRMLKKKYNLSNKPLRVSLLQLRVHGRVMDAEQQKMWF